MPEVTRHSEFYDWEEMSDYDFDSIDMVFCEWCFTACDSWADDPRWGDLCVDCADRVAPVVDWPPKLGEQLTGVP